MTQNSASPDRDERKIPGPPEDYDGCGVARWLSRAALSGALATSDFSEQGAPFASLVNVASDIDGAPLLLLSLLAAHTRHLETSDRCSLLLSHAGKGDPLAHPRLTICGRARRSKDPAIRARFLARHPKSALYADFSDFSFWRLEPDAFHLNGGFGKAARYGAHDILLDATFSHTFVASQPHDLAQLNGDGALLDDVAEASETEAPGKDKSKKWRVSGLDPAGFDLLSADPFARAGRAIFEKIHHSPAQALQGAAARRFKVSLRP